MESQRVICQNASSLPKSAPFLKNRAGAFSVKFLYVFMR